MTDEAWTANRRRFLSLAAGTAAAVGSAKVAAAAPAAPAGPVTTSPATSTTSGGSSVPNPYARWTNGPCPVADPAYFPIGVWLQEPGLAPQYRQAGINLYVGLWEGPTDEQLATLAQHGMPVIADQNATGLDFGADNPLVGWSQQDEPDNAQPLPEGGYGPPVDPAVIVARYRQLVRAD